MTQLAASRASEYALRVMFGAAPPALAGRVVAQSALLCVAGAALGAMFMLLLRGSVQPLVFGVGSSVLAPATSAAAIVLALAAAAAIPAAVRVLRTDPRRIAGT